MINFQSVLTLSVLALGFNSCGLLLTASDKVEWVIIAKDSPKYDYYFGDDGIVQNVMNDNIESVRQKSVDEFRIKDPEGRTLLSYALKFSNDEMIKLVVEKESALFNEPIEVEGPLPLGAVIREGRWNEAKLLVECGADPNRTFSDGCGVSALMLVAQSIVNYQDFFEYDPNRLKWAVELVKSLIAKGTKANEDYLIEGGQRVTPFAYLKDALLEEHQKTMENLLELFDPARQSASVNIKPGSQADADIKKNDLDSQNNITGNKLTGTNTEQPGIAINSQTNTTKDNQTNSGQINNNQGMQSTSNVSNPVTQNTQNNSGTLPAQSWMNYYIASGAVLVVGAAALYYYVHQKDSHAQDGGQQVV